MTDDLKKKMDDSEKNRDNGAEAEACYQQARHDWQGSEENWSKIERGEKIAEVPKSDPKPKPKKKKPEEGLSPSSDDSGG
jgi:hypothetical protein